MKLKFIIIPLFLLVSCFKTNKKIKPQAEGGQVSKPSVAIPSSTDYLKFNVGSIQDLASRSPALVASTQNTDGQPVFITGEIIILGYDSNAEKMVYLENLPKVTEDDTYSTRLMIQDLRNNNLHSARQWETNYMSPVDAGLEKFYDAHKLEIEKILTEKGVFNHISEITIISDDFQKPKLKRNSGNFASQSYLKSFEIIDVNGSTGKHLEQGDLCTACDSSKIIETDVLAQINLKLKFKIYLLGSSQGMEHSPSAVYPRFYVL